MFLQMHKNKRGVSVMIGYILLVTFAVVIAAVVYQWLSTYVPKEGLECPDGVSVYVSDVDLENLELTLEIRNNGKFSIKGLFIYYSNDSSQDVAIYDLSDKISGGVGEKMVPGPGIQFKGTEDNPFKPNDEATLVFDVSSLLNQKIYAIEIVPIRWQKEKQKTLSASCSNAKIKEIVDEEIIEGVVDLGDPGGDPGAP